MAKKKRTHYFLHRLPVGSLPVLFECPFLNTKFHHFNPNDMSVLICKLLTTLKPN
ncbi:hypothetical protein ISN44_As08g032860 [Arabidopsis suecica]|uniref:Uncharacterized protein n=1 Tax=Arabidopsis suecica TaxID=45249 RepID=A0A8T2BCH8_ARASU|nr:hypothetical protein ISN44_As08g032860 [Arabidopsis suecica]